MGSLLTELSQVIEVGPGKDEQHQKHSISRPLPRDAPQKTPVLAAMNPCRRSIVNFRGIIEKPMLCARIDLHIVRHVIAVQLNVKLLSLLRRKITAGV